MTAVLLSALINPTWVAWSLSFGVLCVVNGGGSSWRLMELV